MNEVYETTHDLELAISMLKFFSKIGYDIAISGKCECGDGVILVRCMKES